MKDYYAILELPVTATIPEIKKAYRKLVMRYHPDKNGEDASTTAHFNEIKEAYEVLTNPAAKEQYLQQRWLKKAAGAWMPDEPVTPPILLKKALELNKAISLLDVHRMDAASVARRIIQLLPDETIATIKDFRQTEVNAGIITTLLQACSILPLAQTMEVAAQLQKLAADNTEQLHQIEKAVLHKRQQQRWERKKFWLILLLIAAICTIIYLGAVK